MGSVQVEGLLAHEDHRAIDATGDERRDLLRRHEDHRLVQQRQPLRVAPDDDERAALPQPAERHEVGLAEALPEGEHLPEQFMGLLGVARLEGPQCDRDKQEALLDAVQGVFVHQPLGAPHPATGLGHLAPVEEPERQPERTPHSTFELATVQQLEVGALPRRLGQLVLSYQLRGECPSLQVVDRERFLLIRRTEQAARLSPASCSNASRARSRTSPNMFAGIPKSSGSVHTC